MNRTFSIQIFIFVLFLLVFICFLIDLGHILFSPVSEPNSQNVLKVDDFYSNKLVRERQVSLDSSQSCKPINYGIQKENDPIYFSPSKLLSSCKFENPDFLTLINSSIKTTCEIEPLFIFGPNTDQEHFGNFPVSYSWKLQKDFISNKNTEWIISKCSNQKNVLLRNVFNNTAALRATNITKSLINKHKTHQFRPLTVLLVIFDSVSRQSFYRNLPKTVKFLNENLAEPGSKFGKNFLMYDFIVNNVQGEKTPQNMAPLLYGLDLETVKNYFNDYSIYDQNDWDVFREYQDKHAVWKVFEEAGFVTLFSFDSYTDYIPLITGRKIGTDHVNCNFWKAAQVYADYEDFAETFQCAGNQPPYNLSLNYINEFAKNYKGVNRFGYAHLGLAHESSGTRLKFADDDLIKFFSEVFKGYQDESEDIVLMFGSDHGRMAAVVEREAWQEKLLPLQLVFMNKKLVKRLNVNENLMENVDRLVSRFDWHKTIKELAVVPYSIPAPQINPDIFSLFFQKVPINRTCLDAKIPNEFCSCTSRSYPIPDPNSNTLFIEIAKKSIESINNFLESNQLLEYCQKLELGQLNSVTEDYIKKKDPNSLKNYLIELSDFNSPDFKLKITAVNGKKNLFTYVNNRFGLRPVIEKTEYTQRGVAQKIVTQVIFIENVNNNHTCKGLPRKFQTIQGLCKCVPKAKFEFLVFQETSSSCQTFCQDKKGNCADFNHIHQNLDTLMKFIHKNNIEYDKTISGNYFGIDNNTLIIPTQQYCESVPKISLSFCICAV